MSDLFDNKSNKLSTDLKDDLVEDLSDLLDNKSNNFSDPFLDK